LKIPEIYYLPELIILLIDGISDILPNKELTGYIGYKLWLRGKHAKY